jgi:LCP family protein required for cell wall assembly
MVGECVKQIEQGSIASGELGQTDDASETGTSSQDATLSAAPKRPTQNWLLKGFVFTATTTFSAVLGLAVALMVPLPLGLLSKTPGSDSVWQIGMGYRVARPVNLLIMGIDLVPGAEAGSPAIFDGRTDTMLLVRVDPTTDSINVLSIPRDTQITLPTTGAITKINDANAQGGATLAAKTVSQTLNGVGIDRYVRVSTEALRALIDELGGIEVDVPTRMLYEDKTQKLKIDLQPGLQTLSGEQAEHFARFRQDGLGDIGRVQRQQALLKAVKNKLTNPLTLTRIPGVMTALQQYIDTNLTPEEMLALLGEGRKLSEGKFKMVLLPGRFSTPEEFRASYWILDPAGRDRVMAQYFDVTHEGEGTADRQSPSLRIALQNASGNPNALAAVKAHLAALGLHNIYTIPDQTKSQAETAIVVQQGDLKAATDLLTLLGFGKLAADSTGDLESDLTIRIGEDWQAHVKP